jgi:hypothetical protein
MSQPRADDHDAGARVPSAEVVEDMRRHAQDVHGVTLEPERDVQGLAAQPADVWLTWEAQNFARPARYSCARCPGWTFGVGEPLYGDPVRNAFLLRNNPTLQALTDGLPIAEREALIEAHDRGELGQALANAVAVRAAMRTKRPGAPADLERIARCQEALLARVELGLTVAEAIDELEALHKADPEEQQRIFGREYPYGFETIRKYWKGIPVPERNAARERGRARPVKDRNAERARRRKGKLTP